MSLTFQHGVVWLRRDLRLHDHIALENALQQCEQVSLVFVFDSTILNRIKNNADSRVSYIYDSLKDIEHHLIQYKSSLEILYGDPKKEIPKYIHQLKADALFYNEDYAPLPLLRDQSVTETLLNDGVSVFSFKDAVIFSPHQVLKNDGTPYKVYTPYKNRWLELFYSSNNSEKKRPIDFSKITKRTNEKSIQHFDWLKKINFKYNEPSIPGGRTHALSMLKSFHHRIAQYDETRNYPAKPGTSSLSTAIRHGVISKREMLSLALKGNTVGHRSWLNELIWREFYQMILFHYPYVVKSCFKKQYEKIPWPGKKQDIQNWITGNTGFPLIDAAMRCLAQTGQMHNRLRMVTASFFCKTLLLDWKIGERYFAEQLLDYDLAANNGGWQWCSSTGCDAQPYFRIFNPYTQSKKFDPEGEFIKKYVPELHSLSAKEIHHPSEENCQKLSYPLPIVNYSLNREKAIALYKSVR